MFQAVVSDCHREEQEKSREGKRREEKRRSERGKLSSRSPRLHPDCVEGYNDVARVDKSFS